MDALSDGEAPLLSRSLADVRGPWAGRVGHPADAADRWLPPRADRGSDDRRVWLPRSPGRGQANFWRRCRVVSPVLHRLSPVSNEATDPPAAECRLRLDGDRGCPGDRRAYQRLQLLRIVRR